MNNYYVYVLYSRSSLKYYIGQTSDMKRRLLQHNDANYKSYTSRYAPWEVYWMTRVATRASAMKMERYLKKKRRPFIVRLKTDESLKRYIIEKYGG